MNTQGTGELLWLNWDGTRQLSPGDQPVPPGSPQGNLVGLLGLPETHSGNYWVEETVNF